MKPHVKYMLHIASISLIEFSESSSYFSPFKRVAWLLLLAADIKNIPPCKSQPFGVFPRKVFIWQPFFKIQSAAYINTGYQTRSAYTERHCYTLLIHVYNEKSTIQSKPLIQRTWNVVVLQETSYAILQTGKNWIHHNLSCIFVGNVFWIEKKTIN